MVLQGMVVNDGLVHNVVCGSFSLLHYVCYWYSKYEGGTLGMGHVTWHEYSMVYVHYGSCTWHRVRGTKHIKTE